MEGDITLRITRDPDFFQLNRLEGSRWRVGVAEVDGRVVGCVMGAERSAFLHGVEQRTMYAGDLKVLPTMRGTGVADALIRVGDGRASRHGRPDTPICSPFSPEIARWSVEHRGEERRQALRSSRRCARFRYPLLFPSCVRGKRSPSLDRDSARHRGDDGALAPSCSNATARTRVDGRNIRELDRERAWPEHLELSLGARRVLAGSRASWRVGPGSVQAVARVALFASIASCAHAAQRCGERDARHAAP
jgi:GNAT superfamily N-acetyltransferase